MILELLLQVVVKHREREPVDNGVELASQAFEMHLNQQYARAMMAPGPRERALTTFKPRNLLLSRSNRFTFQWTTQGCCRDPSRLELCHCVPTVH